MKTIFKEGDQKQILIKVGKEDTASFNGEEVHPVYGTFALGRDAEWACRQFVLEMKEEDEEGIGTFLTIEHQSPALVGEQVVFTARVEKIEGNAINCSYIAKVDERIIATGTQGQRILKKEKVKALFSRLKNKNE